MKCLFLGNSATCPLKRRKSFALCFPGTRDDPGDAPHVQGEEDAVMLVLAFWQQLQEEQFVSCTCWQKRDFFSPCTCRTSAAFEALPYLPFLHPVGRRASHASQTKGCFGGGMDSPLQRGASSALLQHIPDPETGLTLQPTGSFAAWKPHAPPSLSTPGAGCARGRCGALGAPSGSTSGRGSVLP